LLPCGLPWTWHDHDQGGASCRAPVAFLIRPMDTPRQITAKSSAQR
jgi:hypothetical protein